MEAWVNYHSHTNYCDGSAKAEDYIKEAIIKGLPAYGFSSHAPVPFSTDWNIPQDRLKDYISDINNLKDKYKADIQIYLGLEIDYIPEIAGRNKPSLKDFELDYYISSIHFVDCFKDGTPWNIDTSSKLFQKGLKEIFRGDYKLAANRFWEISRQMIREEKPKLIGHLDKIKMFNNQTHYFNENEKWYREQVELTLSVLKQHNTIVEINTRGYYRYGQEELYPSEWIIKRMKQLDIPIMINSDSHAPYELTEGMSFAAGILKNLGVEKLSALYDNKWSEYSFTENGLILA